MSSVSTTAPKPVVVARIGAPHGVRGDLKIQAFTEDPQRIFKFKNWFIQTDNADWQPLSAFKLIRKGQQPLIHFDAIDDRDEARIYVNALLGVLRSEFGTAAEGSYYWSDLEGLNVVTLSGEALGRVDHVFDTGSNDVLVVKGERERLIPFISHVISDVDLDQQRITVDWDASF